MTGKRTLVPSGDDWRARATCAEKRADPEMFGPQPRGGAAVTAEALAMCRVCPVIEPCRRAGESDRHAAGVYGGRYIHRRPGRPKKT